MGYKTDTRIKQIKNKVKELFAEKDIRSNKPLLVVLFVIVLGILGLYLRYRLIPYTNGDYTIYISHWYDHLKLNGFSGFRDDFANYNFPYLFLLYLATLVPIGKLVAIKLISIVFDFILTYAVYKILKHFSKDTIKSILGAAAVFFMPTVFINSAFWGQTDAIYTSFVLLSFLSILKQKFKKAWLFFGIAIAFKLQAIFFAPVLIYMWFNKKGKWSDPLIAVATFICLSIPPVLAGRGVVESLTVYARQYGFEPLLSANMPNFYYWLPQGYYNVINSAGILFALVVTLTLTFLAIMKLKYNPRNLLFFMALMALTVPYVVPQMHDRYFFLLEAVSVMLATIQPRYIFALIALQFVTLNVYSKTLFGGVIMPFNIMAGVMLIVFSIFLYKYIAGVTKRDILEN